jgi:tight adherence protein B
VRRRLCIALAAALAGLSSAVAGTASAPLHVTEAGGAQFPTRSYILTGLPAGLRLDPSRVTVRENNHRVLDLSVVPVGEAGGTHFGTVLAIDSSNSMRGAPSRGAVNAARAFAARRNLNQRLAIVTFNSSADVALPFTTSQAAILHVLAQPPRLAYGTHLYDAVAQGVTILRAAGIRAAAVIVLSDGADVGSTIDLDQAIENARNAHVRVFTVGLRSKAFRPGPLQRLAESTGGSFSRADSPEDLAPIYSQLGLELAREYLVSYHSIVQPGRHVRVTVSVDGIGRTTAGYASPALPTAGGVYHHSRLDRIWQSWVTLILIGLLIPALVGFAIVMALRSRGSDVRTRVSDYVTMPGTGQEGDALASRIFGGTERSLERTRWWSRFKDSLALADITIPPVQIIVATVVLTVFAMWLFSRLAGVLFLVGFAVPFVVRALIKGRIGRKRRLFGDQLADNLDVIAGALRAGHSFVGALAEMVNNAPEPSRSEFQRVIADEQLGIAIEDALDRVVKRMRNRDVEQVALVAALQNETGGSAAEVLDRVTENIRERAELRRLVRTLTAQGRLARWIVSLLPVGLLLALSVLNASYMKPLFSHTSGHIMLVFAALMVTAGSVVIGRIVDIEV